MTMKRILSATFGLAALGVMLVGCSTTSSSSSLDRGTMFYRNSEYVSAADAFSEAIARNPRSAAAWNNRAAARLRLGEVNSAIADYNKAIELAPNDAEIYYNRGNGLVAAASPVAAGGHGGASHGPAAAGGVRAGAGRARAGLARDHPRARWRSPRRHARPQDRGAARAGRVPPRVDRESDSAAGHAQIV